MHPIARLPGRPFRRRLTTGWPALLAAVLLAPAQGASPAPGRAASAAPVPATRAPPSVLFGPLYQAVELASVFPDQKTFADAIPNQDPGTIMADYDRTSSRPGFDLKAFVAEHFTLPQRKTVPFKPEPDRSIADYVTAMWTVLERQPDPDGPASSLLPLRFPYVVPGGRFSEIYYWDSYFTMLGLQRDGHPDLARDMIRNLASLIDRYGHIPNGNRTYYLSRSEPPFFACMIDLLAAHDGSQTYLAFLPELQREYDYWMDGADRLPRGQAFRHAVRLPDGTLLNRYWDDRDTPRDESYRQDADTAGRSARPAAELYRDLRAGGESGWDFSSRWLGDGHTLSTIRTTEILPVDLNSLVAHMERTLSHAYALKGDHGLAMRYGRLADRRTDAIRRLMWDDGTGLFTDYVWTDRSLSPAVSAATVVPLFLGLATAAEAHRVADGLRTRLLRPGGLATSLTPNGQQWDSPNGWAPMQWMAVSGLRDYGETVLAATIAQRWIEREVAAYAQDGVLLEKYDVRADAAPAGGGGGGEYPLQVGFGWTNGVLVSLMQLYPQKTRNSLTRHPAASAPAGGDPHAKPDAVDSPKPAATVRRCSRMPPTGSSSSC